MARIARELSKLNQDILTIPGIHGIDNRLDSTAQWCALVVNVN